MGFRTGWYLIRTETGGPNVGRKHCRYFVDTSTYSAQCIIEPNGAQIFQWGTDDPSKYKKAAWSSEFEPLADAPKDDTWDNPETSAGYNPDLPGDYSREQRKPTARELAQRAGHADPACADGLVCTKEIHVGIFFDGTNNNMERDRQVQGHSNVVSLYDAHRDDRTDYFRYYIPGVGTPFEQIGEKTESNSGKAFSGGGEARIHWAMLLVYNAVCASATGFDLMQEKEMTPLVTNVAGGLRTHWRLGDDKMIAIFNNVQQRLLKAVEGKRPTVVRLNLSVFGFSRGAAQARTFCNWLQKATQGVVGTAALKIRFLGVFDTVASVGLADSSPVGNGFMDWADGTMEISGVERGLHYAAAHEIRRSFPLSTARGKRGTAVQGFSEYVYPGVHSNIGGGYSPRDQGKSLGGRSHLLSQIALNDMHFEAINAGAELFRKEQMEARTEVDFVVAPELDAAFSAYTRWTIAAEEKAEDVAAKPKQHVGGRMQYHMQMYWRWRASKATEEQFKAMSSYVNASVQDRHDLWEAEGDWRRDIQRAKQAHEPIVRRTGPHEGTTIPANPSQVQKDLLAAVNAADAVPAEVDTFFDQFVHDSHAGFWLLGPITKYDKQQFVSEVKAKQNNYEMLMRMADSTSDYALAREYRQTAYRYELNNFERRVLETVAKNPDDFPLMTDAEAADLRDTAGINGTIVKYAMGTATRREANGHGQYRRIFDRS